MNLSFIGKKVVRKDTAKPTRSITVNPITGRLSFSEDLLVGFPLTTEGFMFGYFSDSKGVLTSAVFAPLSSNTPEEAKEDKLTLSGKGDVSSKYHATALAKAYNKSGKASFVLNVGDDPTSEEGISFYALIDPTTDPAEVEVGNAQGSISA